MKVSATFSIIAVWVGIGRRSRNPLMHISSKLAEKSYCLYYLRSENSWNVQWEGFCEYFVLMRNFQCVPKGKQMSSVKGILCKRKLFWVDFIQRNSFTNNHLKYRVLWDFLVLFVVLCLFSCLLKKKKKVLPKFLCLIALLHIAERELLYFMWSIIYGAVCLGRISTSHFIMASLQVQWEGDSSAVKPLCDVWHAITFAFLLLEERTFSSFAKGELFAFPEDLERLNPFQ